MQQGVPRFWIDGLALRRRVDNAFPGRTAGRKGDRQLVWKDRFPISLRSVRSVSGLRKATVI